MTKEKLLKELIPSNINLTPEGFVSLEMDNHVIKDKINLFFDEIIKIKEADVSSLKGFGEFEPDGSLPFKTFEDFLVGVFKNDRVGYWFNWQEMYETTCLNQEFFEKYYHKMLELQDYCKNKRFLVNNNTFFDFMITDGKSYVGLPDWTRAGVIDYLLDIVLMDLEKPYLFIPEMFYQYAKDNGIEILNFKERILCMAYFKGLDTLRWHASIDDVESVNSIMASMSGLEERMSKLGD